MVVPGALGAQNGQLEVGIHSVQRNIIAVHFIAGAVGIGHSIGGGLQPVALVAGGILGSAQVQVDDLFRCQADMEGHFAIGDGQGALAIAGFVGVHHTAVGFKFGGIHAVRQSSFGLGLCGGGGGFTAGSLGGSGGGVSGRSAGCGGAAASQQSGQHQGGHSAGNYTILFHWVLPRIVKN